MTIIDLLTLPYTFCQNILKKDTNHIKITKYKKNTMKTIKKRIKKIRCNQ